MKWKRTIGEILLLGMLLLTFNVRQTGSLYPPPTEWTRTYGISGNHDEARSLIQTDDGGYAMLGFTQHWLTGWAYTEDFWLIKIDSAGNVEWNRTYGAPTCAHLEAGQSVVQTDDGGYALAGYFSTEGNPPTDYDVWLIKADSLGSMEWNRTYGGADIDTANSMIQTNDRGYVMTGFTYSYGAGKTDFYLVKTDSTGNMQWNQTYGGTLTDLGYAVVQAADGGYALAGYSNYYINSSYAVIDFWLVKTISGGAVNGDGIVDIFDLSIVGRAYFTIAGDPDYNRDADLNEDGLVDMRDLTMVASNYGTG